MTAPPTIGNSRYLPVLLTTRPASTEINAELTIIGVSSSPLTVGVAPWTVCWYSGRNVIAPNSPRPTKNASAIARLKFLLLNTCSGSIGSAARRSADRNQKNAATATAISPRTGAEVHLYSVPPQVATRMTAVAITPRRIPPR